MRRFALTGMAAILLVAGCGDGEPNVAAVEPEPPMEMDPSLAGDPELANDAAAAEAEDAEIGGALDGNAVAGNGVR